MRVAGGRKMTAEPMLSQSRYSSYLKNLLGHSIRFDHEKESP